MIMIADPRPEARREDAPAFAPPGRRHGPLRPRAARRSRSPSIPPRVDGSTSARVPLEIVERDHRERFLVRRRQHDRRRDARGERLAPAPDAQAPAIAGAQARESRARAAASTGRCPAAARRRGTHRSSPRTPCACPCRRGRCRSSRCGRSRCAAPRCMARARRPGRSTRRRAKRAWQTAARPRDRVARSAVGRRASLARCARRRRRERARRVPPARRCAGTSAGAAYRRPGMKPKSASRCCSAAT